MEHTFGERLKKYRQEKRLTQQELADLLGVSNKTVSRWESDGGYPDVSVLVPLARALGITVDDLLDEERPVRTLTRADYQSLLSFGFALGGGVLFFLLDLFMPVVLCWLAYLGCMAYGVYLQKYYSYQSRWFFLSNGVMNLSVNFSLAGKLISGAAALSVTLHVGNAGEGLAELIWWLSSHQAFLWEIGCLAALILTLAVQSAVWRWSRGEEVGVLLRGLAGALRLERSRPGVRKLLVLLIPAGFAAWWAAYERAGLPIWFYRSQGMLLLGLTGVSLLLCLALFLKRGRRWQLVPALMLTGACALTWFWTLPRRVVSVRGGAIYGYTAGMNTELYVPFCQGTPEIYLLLAAGALLYLLCCFVRITRKPVQEEKTGGSY